MYVSIKPAILESDPAEPKVKESQENRYASKWANRFLGDKEKLRLT
jgi:hypothetical protein